MKELITSRQNPQVRGACGLSEKKKRRETGLFRFDGIKLLREALQCNVEIVSVFVRMPMDEAIEKELWNFTSSGRLLEEQILPVTEAVFEKLTDEKSPEGIVTVARQLCGLHIRGNQENTGEIASEERLLLAESLRDPGNLGTVMRSCAALGIDRLILTSDCADFYNPKTIRGAMGALFRLPTLTVGTEELPALIHALQGKGRRVYAAALRENALKIGEIKLTAGDCFVIGNEGHGLSESTIAACDGTAIIPMREGNESLNAAAAAAICIWETVRS